MIRISNLDLTKNLTARRMKQAGIPADGIPGLRRFICFTIDPDTGSRMIEDIVVANDLAAPMFNKMRAIWAKDGWSVDLDVYATRA